MAPDRNRRRIPDATVSRLPVYLRLLGDRSLLGSTMLATSLVADVQLIGAAV